jgi:hypothetical protein
MIDGQATSDTVLDDAGVSWSRSTPRAWRTAASMPTTWWCTATR